MNNLSDGPVERLAILLRPEALPEYDDRRSSSKGKSGRRRTTFERSGSVHSGRRSQTACWGALNSTRKTVQDGVFAARRDRSATMRNMYSWVSRMMKSVHRAEYALNLVERRC